MHTSASTASAACSVPVAPAADPEAVAFAARAAGMQAEHAGALGAVVSTLVAWAMHVSSPIA